ncbi:MAG: hypothetical protein B6D45_03705 [Ignavibacteriales bacterium UTCHB3]|nr:MAG: hypothetical protein B6D45_03705 [Ignavibacteriales bacterium UTCHB3]
MGTKSSTNISNSLIFVFFCQFRQVRVKKGYSSVKNFFRCALPGRYFYILFFTDKVIQGP